MAIWMTYAMLTGALLALAAWLTEAGLRGRGRATRFAWLGAMVLTVAIPCLAFLPERAEVVAPAPSAATDVDLGLFAMMMGAATFDAAQPAGAAVAPGRDYDRALLAGWALMSGALALAFAAALVGLRMRRRDWRLENVAGADVLVAPDAGPAAVGVFAPRIVLPEWALGAPARALRMMLEHETEHVCARDPLLLAGVGVLLVAMPWNVALWWQAARLREAMELDCDARVLRGHPDPQSYASVLLDVARGESRWLLASPAMARRRSLERRIRLLVPRRRSPRSAALAMVAASGVLLLACAVEGPRPDLSEPTPTDPGTAVAVAAASSTQSAAPARTPEPPVLVLSTAPGPLTPPPADLDAPPVELVVPPAGAPAAATASARPGAVDTPTFTPMTQPPSLRNMPEVRAALDRFYPTVLRDAGVAGTAMVWLFIDERGRVQRTQIQRSSGHAALDDAALRVAQIMEFAPARNRDREVAVWIRLPIAFNGSSGAAASVLGGIDPADLDSLFRTEQFQPAVARPSGYPERLPFVPGTGATVTTFNDGVRAAIFWHDPAEDVVDRATALSREQGWVLVSDSAQFMTPEFGIRVVRLQRDGIERQIVAGIGETSMAMLVQGPPEE